MRTVFDCGGYGRGFGRRKRPVGAPLERSVAMMEGWNATKIFRSNFPIMRITIAISMLAALFRVWWCFLRVAGVLGPSTREYGTCGARIGLARRGARALLDCHDGKDGGRWRASTVFPGNKI